MEKTIKERGLDAFRIHGGHPMTFETAYRIGAEEQKKIDVERACRLHCITICDEERSAACTYCADYDHFRKLMEE